MPTVEELRPEFLLEVRAIELLQRLPHLQIENRRRILASVQSFLDQLERNIHDVADQY